MRLPAGTQVTLTLRLRTGIQQGGPDSGDFLNGVSAISASEAWAVGFFGPTPIQTLAFHFK